MEERKQRNAREFQKQAAQCFHIGGMFKKAQEKADQHKETEVQLTDGGEKRQGEDSVNNTAQPACSLPVSRKQELLELRMQALKNLEQLMDLVTEQEKNTDTDYLLRVIFINGT